jgi:hypothetical protein
MSRPRILGFAARVLVSTIATVALVGPTVGCYTYRVTTPQVGQSGRVLFRQATPVDVVRLPTGTDTLRLRAVTLLDGKLVRVMADTLLMTTEKIKPFAHPSPNQRALIPMTTAMSFSERKFSGKRTLLLFGGITAAFLAVGALAASQMEFEWSESGSGGYRMSR